MKIYKKFFFALVFSTVSLVANAQDFSVSELLGLSSQSESVLKDAASSRGYTYSGVHTSDLSSNYLFGSGQNGTLFRIDPNFASDMGMLGWEFYSPQTYNQLLREVSSGSYKLKLSEKRNRGTFAAKHYSKPGVDVILMQEKTTGGSTVYRVAVRSVNMDKYSHNMGAAHYNQNYNNSNNFYSEPAKKAQESVNNSYFHNGVRLTSSVAPATTSAAVKVTESPQAVHVYQQAQEQKREYVNSVSKNDSDF